MIDFIGKSEYFFGFSLIILTVGIVSFFVNGFVMDVDFKGGTIIEINMGREFDNNELASVVQDAISKNVTVQKMGQKGQQAAIKSEPLTPDERETLFQAVKNHYKLNDDAKLRASDVQAIMGAEIRKKGLTAAVSASLLILAYIAYRFRRVSGLSAGVTAVAALTHDLLIMFSVYSLFNIPVNSSFIAAVLTILGYSINDTIIVYDRIRENEALYTKKTFAEIANMSINQTLTRSIYTALTTAIAVVCIYVAGIYYGVQSIKEFTFPIIIGLVSGTYSSICIASPLWVMWREFGSKNKIAKKTAKA